jgi:predicted aspartyl protease
MGRVVVTFELMNYYDVQQAEHGHLPPGKIRRVALQGAVDTGATRLVLPKGVVDLLGLKAGGTATVHYGDRSTQTRDMVNDAFVQLLGRGSVFNAIVEPNRTDALLGAIVMEDLDLIVDCGKNELVPRDPTTITSEIE